MAALIGVTAAAPKDPKEAECMDWDAYFYLSDDQECVTVWMAWDEYCMSFQTMPDECTVIEKEMQSVMPTLMQQVLKPKHMADKKIPEKKLALLGAKEEFEETSQEADDHSGLIIGASASVIGAAAAILAIRKCTNKSENDSFERAQ